MFNIIIPIARQQTKRLQYANKSYILDIYLLSACHNPWQIDSSAEWDQNTAQQNESHVLLHLAGLALAGLCLAGLGLTFFSLLSTSSPSSEALRFFESAGLDFVWTAIDGFK